MTVALVGSSDDRQINAVATALDTRNTEWVIWDSDQWPGERPLSFEITSGTRTTVGDPVVLDELSAVYFRRIGFDPRGPEFEDALEDRPYSLVNQLREYRGLMMSVLQYLDTNGVPVVNPPNAMSIHSMKPYQLAVFSDADLSVPETLTTNNPDEVAAFVDRVGETIYKPVAGGGHARSVMPSDLSSDRLEQLANAPVQFQERLDGTNYRVFVVNGEAVATARIHSEELDYRVGDHTVEATDPPAPIEHAAVQAVDCLGLAFSGVDFVVGDDGFGILEANPSPMFAGFDEQAGTNVAGHLASFLT
jgi:glutathione synthase/RimK-type ligase-like ATP-grasp enzyme